MSAVVTQRWGMAGVAPARRIRSGVPWLTMLVCATCLEGLGRKFLPGVPSVAFYFLKDVILVWGVWRHGLPRQVTQTALKLLGGFGVPLLAAALWTVLQMLNPEHRHAGLAVLGLRAYWLWWLAPLVVTAALRHPGDTRKVMILMALMGLGVSGFAAYQFALPADAALNTYALYEGQALNDVDIVQGTGRVRVSSTFSYTTGFTAFTELIPPILLAWGLGVASGRVKLLCMVAVGACLATLPMAGSRGALLYALTNMFLVALGAGFLRTRTGRRVVISAAILGAVGLSLSPDALKGVMSRFTSDESETTSRLSQSLTFLPPVAMTRHEYPLFGVGTGMEQNAAYALGLAVTRFGAEDDHGKTLVELGALGYLLVWLSRAGLALALLRAGRRLRRAGQGAQAGVALALAFFAVTGKYTFDHVAQALFFLVVGLVLHAVCRLPTPPPMFHGPQPVRRPPVRRVTLAPPPPG